VPVRPAMDVAGLDEDERAFDDLPLGLATTTQH